jgi:UDP-glucose 4-epimerase
MNLAHSSSVDALASFLTKHSVDAVIHFAARKQVGESVAMPAWYFSENVGGLANVLLALERAGVSSIIFSSSAAVYGDARGDVSESAPKEPTSPYGETKLVGEWLLSSAAAAQGLDAISLRYFNVAGAGWPELGDKMALNLVPMVFERLDAQESPRIFGDDYNTPDGTCVRDYVHVMDLAEAHVAALDALRLLQGWVDDATAATWFRTGQRRLEGSSPLEALVEGLRQLLAMDAPERERRGREGRERVVSRHSLAAARASYRGLWAAADR